jgi:hypothetical protein
MENQAQKRRVRDRLGRLATLRKPSAGKKFRTTVPAAL